LLETGLAPRQSSVAEIAELGPAGIFATIPREIWLEIGFGGGEHLAWQAAHHPDIGLIGCEVFQTGIATLLAQLAHAAHGGTSAHRAEVNNLNMAAHRAAADNVRIVVDDARLVLQAVPEASLARLFILFPDPWPKTRHHKRRIVQPSQLAQMSRVLKNGGELRLATDDPAYLRAMLAAACGHGDFEWLARRPEDWRRRPPDWPQTRYEAKAIAQGRTPAFLRLTRRPRA
jgi:tRNA (guanine-N7-)-methyltransferase